MAAHSAISTIKFGVASDDYHKRMSAATITSPELFTGSMPVAGGAYDARLGTTDHFYRCSTCGGDKRRCPGHPGQLSVPTGMAQPMAVDDIKRWLKIVCFKCGSPMVALEKYAHIPRQKRLAEAVVKMAQPAGTMKCPVCGVLHPKVESDPNDNVTVIVRTSDHKAEPQRLMPYTIRQILDRVSDATVVALGKPIECHPRHFILFNIQVPPVSIRPGVRGLGVTANSNSYHSMNTVIQNIVKRCQNLPNPHGALSNEEKDFIQVLQQIYYDFIKGSAGASPAQGNRGKRAIMVGSHPVMAILRRFPHKLGRLRLNLLGKRVWNISRTTISGNTSLKVDEVGVPVMFARTLQIEETVQPYNIDRLRQYVLNARRSYPGCTQIRKGSTGSIYCILELKQDFQLEPGDVVYRDVVTGDVAFFNRPPSLERSSISAMRVVIIQDPGAHTFQMNVASCEWFNADFDGDQMSLWVPHKVMSRVETALISMAHNWFISTKTSQPVNGEIQDATVGAFAISRDEVRMDKFHAMSMLQNTDIELPIFGGDMNTVFTGREVVSKLLGQTPITYKRAPAWYNAAYAPYVKYSPAEVMTVIRRGELVSGVLDKKSVGNGQDGGIFHLIAREYGPQKALRSIYAVQQMTLSYMDNHGFTVAATDMVLPRDNRKVIAEIVTGMAQTSSQYTDRLMRGELIAPIGMTIREMYEQQQIEKLRVPDDVLRPILTGMNQSTNGLLMMIMTGSKGNMDNLKHIVGTIGQVTINGERIRELFSYRRTLVYFPRCSTSPEAYGFVKNCYINGLTPSEYIFSAMNGRFDIITKALATAATGYQMRKSIMSMQSAITDCRRRVQKDANVVQYLYGEDGVDPRQIENVDFATVRLDDHSLREQYFYAPVLAGGLVFDHEYELIKADRDVYRDIFMRLECVDFSMPMTTTRKLPVNVDRIVENILALPMFTADGAPAPTATDVAEMVRMVHDFCDSLPYVMVNEHQRAKKAKVPAYISAATVLIQMQVRMVLCAKKTLHKINSRVLKHIFSLISLQYTRSLIQFGEPVGILATQAVSEPLTQYMLDSHHRSVTGGTNKDALIRSLEILKALPVEKEQSSLMRLYVKPEYAEDLVKVHEIANSIELMNLKRFVKEWQFLYESVDDLRYPPFLSDNEWMDDFKENFPLVKPPIDLSQWCFRFELDRPMMILKSIQMEYIANRLRVLIPEVYIIHTSENAKSVIMRMFLRNILLARSDDLEKKLMMLLDRFTEVPLRGIEGITSTEVNSQISRSSVGEGGELVSKKIYSIRTDGTNFRGVLSNQHLDAAKITTSSVGDTCAMLGIEAARMKIITEMRRTLSDRAPSYRHMMLYADEMTRRGRLSSLERGGLAVRESNNILLRMGMGAPIPVLTEASINGIKSDVYGISAPLMLGATPSIGSKYTAVVMDDEFVRNNTTSIDDIFEGL